MKYDDAEYYYLNFTTDLPNEAGGRHIGLFLEWAVLRGLASEELNEQASPLRSGATNYSDLLFDHCDGKLMDDDLGPEGNAFAADYYEKYHLDDVAAALNVEDEEDDDAFFAAELTPQRHRRVLWQLDRRYSDWRRQFGLLDKEALLERVLAIIAPAAEAAGFPRVAPSGFGTHHAFATFERRNGADAQRCDLIAIDHSEWFYGVRVECAVYLEALYDKLYAEKTVDLEIASSTQYAAEIPFTGFAQGWHGPTQTYLQGDHGFWIFRDEDIEPLAQWLATRLRDFALPVLRELSSVATLAQAYATTPLSASPIHDARDAYAALLAAEMVQHPRLDAMLDETEQALRTPGRHLTAYEAGQLKLIARIRARRGPARLPRSPRDRW